MQENLKIMILYRESGVGINHCYKKCKETKWKTCMHCMSSIGQSI